MDSKDIGTRIRIARSERCISQRELAETVGCTVPYISTIERGKKVPSLETFIAMATALKVSADVLLQDVMPNWWASWEKEIDRVLAPLLPHNRAYIKSQIIEYHQLEETCAEMGQWFPQR
jgi:transcriptional regulator with XRE-family HTH domain